MANNPKSKLKLLYLKRILEEETDAEHGLTMPQIIARLNEYGIPAERKSVYRDFKTLREFGLDIQSFQRSPVEYALIRDTLTLPELMLLADAVESRKSLTRRQSVALVTSLKSLASNRECLVLDRNIHVSGRIISKNDSVFGNIDLIHEAMRTHRQVRFLYYRYDLEGERKTTNDGKKHEVTPVDITCWDGFYYLTAWSEERDSMCEFRIDRMGKLRVSRKQAVKNDEIAHYACDEGGYESFDRSGGDLVTVQLLVDADKVEVMLDRFGDAAELHEYDANTAMATVRIRISEPFFGWLAGLGGTVRIAGPARLKEEYRTFLQARMED